MAGTLAFINGMLDTAFTGTLTMKLFRGGLPSTTGEELSGGGYAVQTFTMDAAASKIKSSAADITFSDLPTGNQIVAYGVYLNGTLVDENTLTTPFTPDLTNNELNISYSFRLNA